jgi:hypothetical protein
MSGSSRSMTIIDGRLPLYSGDFSTQFVNSYGERGQRFDRGIVLIVKAPKQEERDGDREAHRAYEIAVVLECHRAPLRRETRPG